MHHVTLTTHFSGTNYLRQSGTYYASILYRFRDTASYLSKIADLTPPQLHSAPPLGVTPVEFRRDLWHQKTRVPGLSCGIVCVIYVLQF